MASTDGRPIPKKNTAYRVTFPILDADGDLVTGATGLDSEVSIDGGTFGDCTNEATEIATSSGMYYLDLTSSEMNGDTIAVIVKTSSSGAKTTPIVLYPEEAGDIRVDVTMISGDATAADNSESFFDGTGYAGTNNVIPTVTTTTTATNVTTVNGLAANVITATSIQNDAITAAKIADGAIDAATFATGAITAAAIAADAIGASELAADAVTEIQSGLATAASISALNNLSAAQVNAEVDIALADVGVTTTVTGRIDVAVSTRASQSSLDTVDDFLDTEISAILADTNELQTDWVNGGRLDLLIDAIKAKTDNLPADPADDSDIDTQLAAIVGYLDTEIAAILAAVDTEIATLVTNVAAILADTGTDGVVISSTVQNAIADAILSRGVSNVEDTANTTSLATLILAALESSISGTTWTIRKTGGTTFVTKTVTVDDTADPITGVT